MWRTIFFTTLVPLIWLGVHYYVGRSLIGRSQLPQTPRRALWGLLALMWSVSLASSLLPRLGLAGPWMDPLHWVNYLYMGFFSITLALLLLRDLALALAALPRLLRPREPRAQEITGDSPINKGRRTFLRGLNLGLVGVSGAMTAFGAYKALRTLDVEEVTVPIPDLPEDLEGFTIVQISDLHVGPTIRRPFVEKVVQLANSLKGDMIAVTGDLVDGYVEERRHDVAPLADLQAPEGVFYVTGNHEYYWGAQPWIDEARRLGMVALINAHQVIRRGQASLVVAGVTDLRAGQFTPDQPSDPHRALRGAPQGATRVLMAHQPKSAFEAVKAGVHLQLSGHTHGGQFVPWSFIVWLAQPFVAGLHSLEQMQLYVSRGTGYWGPPVRIAANPEITRLTLTRG